MLRPSGQQQKCPKCKTRQMRDITPNHRFSKEFHINDEYLWATEPERDVTWDLNDFDWKKWTIWDQIEAMAKSKEDDIEEEEE